VTIVRNHRHVFRQAAQLNPHERAGLVASHTAILKMNERIEDVQVWDSRLTVHSAEVRCLCDAERLVLTAPDDTLHLRPRPAPHPATGARG
jgi:hypothetical protein